MPLHRSFLAVLCVVVLAACGGGGDDPGTERGEPPAANLPAACTAAPFTMRLEAGGTAPAGDAEFGVTDAVARRVAILPGIGTVSDPEELEANAEAASRTPLALYQVTLSDAPVDRTRLTGSGFGEVTPEPGQTVGQLAIVPESEEGFRTGDVADNEGTFDYEPDTTFGEITLTVLSGEAPTAVQGYDDAQGQVEVLHVDATTICLDVDLEFTNGGELIYAAEGVVTAPVVRAADHFYFT